MQKVIDQITNQLVGLIQKDQSSYSPQQLLQAGIPSYIVERVRLLLEDKVLADFQKPGSEWIETDNKLFESSWKDFRSTVISCSVIPRDKVYEILHNTINDIISVFVEPRKYMALYLFRDEKVLSFDEMSKRCARLTIYKHFGKAIPLYMAKKGLSELSLERCQKLIASLDARIVSNYTPENWAQKLELLFTLFGGKLDPKLLKTFFTDKGLTEVADIFAQIDVAVTQSTFVEMLSSEKIDFATAEKTEPEVKKQEIVPQKSDDSISDPTEEEEENLANAFQNKEPEPEINEILGDISEKGIIESNNIEEAASLNALYSSEEEEETESENETEALTSSKEEFKKQEEREQFRTNISSILDQAKESLAGTEHDATEEVEEELISEDELILDPAEEEPDQPEIEEPKKQEQVSEQENLMTEYEASEMEAENSEEEEEKPMWAQFLSEDQMEVMMAKREGETEEASINDSLYVEDEDDELIIEAPQEKSDTIPLNGYLHEKETEWAKALFGGNNAEYKAAVKKIESFEDWKQASEYVETQIFNKEYVDMFSEEAIGFIDVLQTYFKKYKS